MSNVFELNAEVRHDVGKGASRRLRREANKVPAIIYGAKKEAQPIVLDQNKIKKALENEAFYSHILTLDISGEKQKVVLKDMQRHPWEPRVLHMDFLRISETEKIIMNIPLHTKGAEVAPGIKKGGLLSHSMSSVEISCLPADLPEYIEVDVSQLDLNGVLHLSDLSVPKGVELVALAHGHDEPVISIHMPRAVEEEPAAETPSPEVEAIKQSVAEPKEGKEKAESSKETKESGKEKK